MNNMEHLIFTGLQSHWKARELRKVVLESAMVERDPEHTKKKLLTASIIWKDTSQHDNQF